MKNYSAKEIKNIVLIGAPGTGKTTLAEAMAFEGKVIDRRGSIEANNTLSDNTDIEHEYKRSIYSTILFTEFMDRKLNIIDCPGSDDFCGSLFSAFKVGDVGVFLFNAQNGWEVGSEIQARYARLLQKPVIGVVNQLDAEKASFEATVESIRASSRVKPVIVQYPVNQGPEFNAFIDVLLMKMYRFKDNDGHREELEIPAEDAAATAAQDKYVWPVDGAVLRPYAMTALAYDETMSDWRTHDGIDIEAKYGTVVSAMASGTVTKVYYDDLYGTTVVTEREDGLRCMYANLESIPTVNVGDQVSVGDTIGSVGDSAGCESAQESHLHLSVAASGQSVSPLDYLPQKN